MLKVNLPATGQGFVLRNGLGSAVRSEVNPLLKTIPLISLLPMPLVKCKATSAAPKFLGEMVFVELPAASNCPWNDERTPPTVNFALNDPARRMVRLRN